MLPLTEPAESFRKSCDFSRKAQCGQVFEKLQVDASRAVQVQRLDENHAHRPPLGMRSALGALPDVERDRVERVVVSGADGIVMRVLRRKLDLALGTPAARFRAGRSTHGQRVARARLVPESSNYDACQHTLRHGCTRGLTSAGSPPISNRMPQRRPGRTLLTHDERDGIVLAVNSAFRKLKNLYEKILPIFDSYGFRAPSAGVIARDLSEKIEKEIERCCSTFERGVGHADLRRFGTDWEVKICKDSGLTINQSKQVNGENYIVVNYKANSVVKSIWILWEAQDRFFSPRLRNSNARAINRTAAHEHIEVIYEAPTTARR